MYIHVSIIVELHKPIYFWIILCTNCIVNKSQNIFLRELMNVYDKINNYCYHITKLAQLS